VSSWGRWVRAAPAAAANLQVIPGRVAERAPGGGSPAAGLIDLFAALPGAGRRCRSGIPFRNADRGLNRALRKTPYAVQKRDT